MFDIFHLIKYPIVTEKATLVGQDNKYIFAVSKHANKFQIKEALENIYKVKVISVSVINIHPKKKRTKYVEGYKSSYKKAIVTLREGDKIAVT